MRLELLGPGRLISKGGDVFLRSGLPLALLAYLHRSGGPVLREHLAVLFWPGRPRPLALQSLRQAVRRLRATCGDDVVEADGRFLRAGAGLPVSCDADELEERVREGDAAGALTLWQGSFLEDFRLPQSWEVEDWLERERSGLSAMLLSCVEGELRERLRAGGAPGALGLVEAARIPFPQRAELARLHFDALLALGRTAEAARVLEELRVMEEGEGVGPLEERLAAALTADAGEGGRPSPGFAPGTPEAGPSTTADGGAAPHPTGGANRSLGGRAALLLFAVVALVGGGWWTRLDPLDGIVDGLRDRRILYCHAAGTGGRFEQPAWMDFDGRNKHRISDLRACEALWLEGAGALVALQFPLEEGEDYRLLRLDPLPGNPIAEWTPVPLGATAGLRALHFIPRGTGFLDGRFVAVTGVDSTGVRHLYLVDVAADTARRLTHGPGNVRYPAFDPVRREVIFSREGEGPAWDLWALPVDDPGASPARLTASPSEDTRASVHGDRILFNRGWGEGPTEGDMEIRLLDRVSGREEVLVSNPWNEYQAAWSPDGRHICWQSDEFGHFESDILVMEVATRRQWSVTRRVEGRSSACYWTPDGRGLLYHGTVGGVTQTILTDLRGRRHRNLSRDGFISAVMGFMPALEQQEERDRGSDPPGG